MTVRRILAGTAISAGLLAAAPGVAGAQSPPEVSPTSVVQVQGTQLSRTGQDTMPVVYIGAGLAAAGAVLVVAARKRRDTVAPA
jgi:LPXTG-motif cell wall-anchored protein